MTDATEGELDGRQASLSTLPAGPGPRRLALWALLVSALIFLVAAPFAKLSLPQIPAFLPVYQSALVINDLITAVLLYSQFKILRSPALLTLATAYLLSGLMAVCHMLSFPGLFAPTGLFGAGPQTTAWLYFLWHGAFPLMIIAYALTKDAAGGGLRLGAGAAILASVAASVIAACGLMLLTTAGHSVLPAIMQGNIDSPEKFMVASCTWILSLVALGVLWRRRPHTLVDLWLMVTMCVWIFDVALASVLNHARYDLGWYTGRVYGLLAASFVLTVLLVENGVLYSRLAEAHASERRERRLAQQKSAELVELNKELDAFSYSVSHDLRAPLRAIDGYALMLEEDYRERLDAEGQRLLRVVRDNTSRMGRLIEDLLTFSRLGRKPIASARLDMEALANEVATELLRDGGAARVRLHIGPMPATSGDRSLLRQVWINLIGNAFKYSGKSESPSVEVTGRQEGAECVYRVKDNGVGFDMRYYDKLFGVFQRLHDAKEFPGTGVGLAIVQRVIARHGGRIWAESTPGQGAVFCFALPHEDTLADEHGQAGSAGDTATDLRPAQAAGPPSPAAA